MSPSPISIVAVFAGPLPWPSGGQVLALGQARGLAMAGARVCVAAWGFGREDQPLDLERLGVPLWGPKRAQSGPHAARVGHDLALTSALAAHLRRERTDVLLAHHVEGLWAALLARKVSGSQARIVWVPHTSLGEEIGDYSLPAPALLTRLGFALDRRLPSLADAVIALSPRAEAAAREAGAAHVYRVAPGVEPTEVQGGDGAYFRAHYAFDDRPIVLYTGNADRYQQLARFGTMARALSSQAHWVVLTHGSADDAARAVASGAVRVIGRVGRQTLKDGLAAAALGVVPREVCAGFPMKVLHHLGAGHPVIASRALDLGLTGVVEVEGADDGAWVACARSLLASKAQTAALGQVAQQMIAANATWSLRGSQIYAIFSELLA